MKKPKGSAKWGRTVDIYAKTDVAATFRRIRAEQARAAQELERKVTTLKVKGAKQ